MGRLMLLALEYKLDSVCNAERVLRYRRYSCSPMGTRTKINYKDSITLYIVLVNIFNTICCGLDKKGGGCYCAVLLLYSMHFRLISSFRERTISLSHILWKPRCS